MTIQQLEPITMAKGAAVKPSFTFINPDKSVPDLSKYKGYYILSPYGFEDENVLSIKMDSTDNKFTAIIDTSDIKNLDEGTYTAKVVLVDDRDNQYKYARGVFNILKDTTEVGVTI